MPLLTATRSVPDTPWDPVASQYRKDLQEGWKLPCGEGVLRLRHNLSALDLG